ncbi:acyltransferase family protein [Catenuloplanes atrovinosus]|uniref:Peptidoglycan/LPS O-acetylase OafA/YrhL n=1 Tax=Catenuloplanes atrovinosus TaxID=137266 RepID=A0AAE3YSM1_9ACTN|nr:acyltransferase [Catenuloplanes atrovinosus]MDR7278482.1 peptidoglycan/LPS O-acetylase OafA/YrhL [Catenuloplanes atrovinosus]
MAATRERYFDLLRAVAIARVVTYHMFPLAALELIFPSMGVMFALGGSLMARSLDRAAAGHTVIVKRLRRLLPALWVLGAVAVPAMLLHGWADPPWARLLLWVLPIADPPANEFGAEAAGPLWYLVTYLWLVVLSPGLLWLYRRAPLPMLAAPPVLLVLLLTVPIPLPETPERTLVTVLQFATAWMLGFAHRDGDLRRLPGPVTIALSAACVAGALGWWWRAGDGGIAELPLAYAIFSAGLTLVLLRWTPPTGWLRRVPPLDGLVTLVNARAVTIYLWHNPAITAALAVADAVALWNLGTVAGETGTVVIALALLAGAVLAVGWVEDVAARRPPRLLPRTDAPATAAPRPARELVPRP